MKRFLVMMLLVTMLCMPVNVYAESTVTTTTTDNSNVNYELMFKQVLDLIREGYIDGDQISEQELYEGAMKGMFDRLDVYSEFMTPEQADAFTSDLNASFVGIGVRLIEHEDYVIISSVFNNSPAAKAGLQKGDYFIKANGVDVQKASARKLQSILLGEEGTTVEVTMGRGGTTFTKTLTRAKVITPTVESTPIKEVYNNLTEDQAKAIEYINLSSFSAETEGEFKTAIEAAKARGVKYLLLDMRDNGGGYVSTAVNIAKMIVPKGPIVYFKNSFGEETVYSSTLETPPFEIVVLANENSASATEFVTAAIKDSGVGEVVGETTFGKGVAQHIFDYELGYTIKLTMQEFFTRNQDVINNIGVKPNYFVEIPDFLVGKTKYHPQDEAEGVINIEKVLNYLGYSVGRPDIKYDAQTTQAVKKFQADQGLYVYGICDLTTQAKLNAALQKSIEKNDPQIEKAIDVILHKMNKN